jgi:hypothetical protein
MIRWRPVALDLRPLVGERRVLDGQLVQPEQVGQLRQFLSVRIVDLNPEIARARRSIW